MRHRWLAGIFAVSAVWAVLVAVVSSDHIHQLWGEIAAIGYGLALIAVLAVWHSRRVDVALGLAFLGGLVVPLGYLAARGLMQPEVSVVAESAVSLVHHGTPYTSWNKLEATTNQDAYNPYLPLMAVFGLPRALFDLSVLTDPRVWFGIVFIAVFWLALDRGGARHPVRWTALVAGSPIIAFELAVGGTDVPMVAFLCLGFAYLWTRKPALAGVALGIGSSMKATAWPALAVAVALLAVTMGKRAVRNFVLSAIAVMVVCIGPFIFGHPRALVENTIMFPLGLASVRSAASSPLPGHIIAAAWPGAGHTIVVALLVLAGLAIAASLVLRPPRSVPRAVVLLAGAMTLMFVLAPSTRFGYFIYPAALAIWVFAARAGRQADDAELGEIEVDFLPAGVPDGPPVT
jgi:hypothetical protein